MLYLMHESESPQLSQLVCKAGQWLAYHQDHIGSMKEMQDTGGKVWHYEKWVEAAEAKKARDT